MFITSLFSVFFALLLSLSLSLSLSLFPLPLSHSPHFFLFLPLPLLLSSSSSLGLFSLPQFQLSVQRKPSNLFLSHTPLTRTVLPRAGYHDTLVSISTTDDPDDDAAITAVVRTRNTQVPTVAASSSFPSPSSAFLWPLSLILWPFFGRGEASPAAASPYRDSWRTVPPRLLCVRHRLGAMVPFGARGVRGGRDRAGVWLAAKQPGGSSK